MIGSEQYDLHHRLRQSESIFPDLSVVLSVSQYTFETTENINSFQNSI